MKNIPRDEYPRPQFARPDWMNLNGVWQFEMDHGRSGRDRKLFSADALERTIVVPFCPESALSGIAHTDFMECVWYLRKFTLPEGWGQTGRQTILHIGACDYQTEVFINGESLGTHVGGYSSFQFDITRLLRPGENTVAVCAEDDLRGGGQPVGKQCDKFHSQVCSYTRTTGIWQTVWLENVPSVHIASARYTPMIEEASLLIEAECPGGDGYEMEARASFGGIACGMAKGRISGGYARFVLPLKALHLWSLDEPNLYDLSLRLGEDHVESYFGMRSVSFEKRGLHINGRPVFMRLILDQGFYPDGVITAPSDEALIKDIELSKSLGFNGARLHQKVFEPRFLYHCDRLGYLAWGESASWGIDWARDSVWPGFIPEWLEVLRRDYNHPSIIGWCPFNELHHPKKNSLLFHTLYQLTKAVDSTRLFIDASGYDHVIYDLLDVHDGDTDVARFKARYDALMEGKPAAHPMLGDIAPDLCFISEFGGLLWNPGGEDGWGYGAAPESEAEFIERYRGLVEAILQNSKLSGFCYIQLTDVEQEKNGLLYYDRRPKFDTETVRKINTGPSAWEANLAIRA